MPRRELVYWPHPLSPVHLTDLRIEPVPQKTRAFIRVEGKKAEVHGLHSSFPLLSITNSGSQIEIMREQLAKDLAKIARRHTADVRSKLGGKRFTINHELLAFGKHGHQDGMFFSVRVLTSVKPPTLRWNKNLSAAQAEAISAAVNSFHEAARAAVREKVSLLNQSFRHRLGIPREPL